jgi:ribosomal protein S20
MLKDKMKELETGLTDRYKKITKRVKEHIESEVRRVIEKMIKQLLRRVRRFARRKIVNKNMFSCVKDTVDDIFDDLWPELENEIMYALRLQFDLIKEYKKPKVENRNCFTRCLSRTRALYLYAQYPCK